MGEPPTLKLRVKPWIAVVVLAAAVVVFGGIGLLLGNRRLERELGPVDRGDITRRPNTRANRLAMRLNVAGNSYSDAGMYDSALTCYREALRISQEAGLTARMAASYHNISNVFDYKNMPESVRFYRNAAIALDRATGKPSRVIGGLLEEGTFRFQSLGDVESGRVLLELGLAECRKRGDLSGEAMALNNLGTLQGTLKHYDSARMLFESCAAVSRRMNDRSTEAGALHNLALTYLSRDRLDDAKKWLLKTIEVAHAGGIIGEEATALFDIALIRAEQDDYELAKVNVEQAQKLFQQAGDAGGVNACRAFLTDIIDAQRWRHRVRTLDSLFELRKNKPDQGI